MINKNVMNELSVEETLEIEGGTIAEGVALWYLIDTASKCLTGESISKHAHDAVKDYEPGGSTWGINGY